MKKKLLAAVLCLAMALTTAACGSSSDSADSSEPAAEGTTEDTASGSSSDGSNTVVVAMGSGFSTLDPGYVYEKYPPLIMNACYENLFKFYSNDGAPEPCLADTYEFSDDNLTLTVNLKQNVTFASGNPMTSADVAFSINRCKNLQGNPSFICDTIESIETPDDLTVVFHLTQPDSAILSKLTYPSMCVLDSAVVKENGGTDAEDASTADTAQAYLDTTSAGSGMYVMTSYTPDQEIVLEKNENYWNADAVKLDTITYRFFDDTQSMANAYEAGEVDVATSLQSEVMERYEGSEDLMVTDLIATRYIYPNLDVEPLDDVRVRKAISLAINREELCSAVGKDTSPTYNLVSKYMTDKTTGEYFVDGAAQPFEEDVEEARRLLAEAGYPDGEGFPVLTYKYPTLEMDSDTAQVIKEQLKQNLNIDINLQAQELQTNYSDRHAKNFELCRMNWTADFADPDTYLSMLLSNSTYNCSNIADEEYDSLVLRAQTETDAKTRMELMHEAELYAVGEQFYVIPLYGMQSCNLVNPDVTGIGQIAASGALEYRYAEKK